MEQKGLGDHLGGGPRDQRTQLGSHSCHLSFSTAQNNLIALHILIFSYIVILPSPCKISKTHIS